MTRRPVTITELQAAAMASCTNRQIEILRLYASNLSTYRIAVELGVSRATVREHLASATRNIKKHLDDQPQPQEPAA